MPVYGAGVCKCNKEPARKIDVCFNDAIKRTSGHRRYETVRTVLFDFGILPVDLYVAKSSLSMEQKHLFKVGVYCTSG